MSESKRITWDDEGERLFQTGVSNGVFYGMVDEPVKHSVNNQEYGTLYTKAEAWNGLTSVNQSPDGAEPTDLYADNVKYATLRSAETFAATVECYMYPDGFKVCNGEEELIPGVYASGQNRKSFGFTYRNEIGNDVKGTDYGYKLHLVYGASVSPSEENHETINDSPDAEAFSYELTSTPVTFKKKDNKEGKLSHLEIDSTKISTAGMKAIEDVLYGTETTDAYLPTPDEVVAIIKNADQIAG